MNASLHDLKTAKGYYSQVMNFQDRHYTHLIENSYYILPERYFGFMGLYTYRAYPPIKDNFPINATLAAEHMLTPLDTATFNLNRHFNKDVNIPFLKENMTETLAEFKELTDKPLIFCSGISRRGKGQEDLLLTCYPGRVDKEGWSPTYDHQSNQTKAQFFAFLWHKNFITEDQLYDSNDMLGLQHYQILNQKHSLEKTGHLLAL